ncbi:hypothetical protein QN277_012310 [Acacia crassicarpa]|uniref:Retrotransposon gag domain-containing protein n=1 Tax=Acacia crassicarpa TaxID=499986 RepID=A0AAE1TEH0_9FABA|nr:hypothetical protein QN277_012310 [Acacia crassicarpa]
MPIIRGHRLDGHVLGTKAVPPECILDSHENVCPNPLYDGWLAIDQLQLGWLFSTLTVNIAAQMTTCKTSAALWRAITELVGTNTRSRITFLKIEFQQLRKGSLKMHEYLAKIKALSDNLTLARCPLSLTDLITQTLAGLDSDYTPIVVILTE